MLASEVASPGFLPFPGAWCLQLSADRRGDRQGRKRPRRPRSPVQLAHRSRERGLVPLPLAVPPKRMPSQKLASKQLAAPGQQLTEQNRARGRLCMQTAAVPALLSAARRPAPWWAWFRVCVGVACEWSGRSRGGAMTAGSWRRVA